ncbi:MAG: hypothetical protein JWR72_586 [Flavisolibacter sp.]|nr:hypothetical protein [Flavisolibacter sp.]
MLNRIYNAQVAILIGSYSIDNTNFYRTSQHNKIIDHDKNHSYLWVLFSPAFL